MRKKKDTAFGRAVIESLTEFLETRKRGEPITARTIKLNLTPNEYTGKEVERTRTRLGVSQPVFAQLLAVSVKLVQAWEQDQRKPSGLACRLLDDINRDPQLWLRNHLPPHVVNSSKRASKRSA